MFSSLCTPNSIYTIQPLCSKDISTKFTTLKDPERPLQDPYMSHGLVLVYPWSTRGLSVVYPWSCIVLKRPIRDLSGSRCVIVPDRPRKTPYDPLTTTTPLQLVPDGSLTAGLGMVLGCDWAVIGMVVGCGGLVGSFRVSSGFGGVY